MAPPRLHINIRPAMFKWQAKHEKRLTYEELSIMADIPIASLYRMVRDRLHMVDLNRLYKLCVALECEVGDILKMPEE